MPRVMSRWEVRKAGLCPHFPSTAPPLCWITQRTAGKRHCGGLPDQCLAERWEGCCNPVLPDGIGNRALDAFIYDETNRIGLFEADELHERSLNKVCARWPPPDVSQDGGVCSWLRGAISYVAMDLTRRVLREQAHFAPQRVSEDGEESPELRDTRPGPDEVTARKLTAESLWELLPRLEQVDPRLRQVVELVYWQGLPIQEVAETMGVSRNTPRNLINKAMPLLAQWWKESPKP